MLIPPAYVRVSSNCCAPLRCVSRNEQCNCKWIRVLEESTQLKLENLPISFKQIYRLTAIQALLTDVYSMKASWNNVIVFDSNRIRDINRSTFKVLVYCNEGHQWAINAKSFVAINPDYWLRSKESVTSRGYLITLSLVNLRNLQLRVSKESPDDTFIKLSLKASNVKQFFHLVALLRLFKISLRHPLVVSSSVEQLLPRF